MSDREDADYLEDDAPPLLLLRARGGAAAANDDLDRLLETGRVAAIVMDPANPEWEAAARRGGVARLVVDQPMAMDGALLRDLGAIQNARARRPQAILGAHVGLDRHDAMVAGEAGCDYLLCGSWDAPAPGVGPAPETRDFLLWWSELFTLPIAAAAMEAEDAGALVAAGADFVSWSWRGADDAMAALAAMDRAFARRADPGASDAPPRDPAAEGQEPED